jgi:hypothetical protein
MQAHRGASIAGNAPVDRVGNDCQAVWPHHQHFILCDQEAHGNTAHGVAKTVVSRTNADRTYEWKECAVAAIVLYPGLVRTKKVFRTADYLDLSNPELRQIVCCAVVALAAGSQVMQRSGRVETAATLVFA